MKKLLAFVSSIAVCASALAVSVFSCFPSTDVGAVAPSLGLNQPSFANSLGDAVDINAVGGLLNWNSGNETSTGVKFQDLENGVHKVLLQLTFYTDIWGTGITTESVDNFTLPIDFEWGLLRVGTYSFQQWINFTFNQANPVFPFYLSIRGVDSLFNYGLGEPTVNQYSGIYFLKMMNGAFSSDPSQYTGEISYGPTFTIGSVGSVLSQTIYTASGRFFFGLVGKASFDALYNSWYEQGHSDGYSAGDTDGYSRGVGDASSQFGMWDLFSNAFGSIGNILNIQLFPGLSVGLLLSVPIAFAFILWLIHVLKG